MNKSNLPLGVRLNNPGNVEWSDPWQGLVPRSESMYFRTGSAQQKRFAQFVTPAYGIRALARTLITYQDRHGIRTVRQAINRWAPPVENDTGAYIAQVAKAVGVGPDHEIDMQDYRTLRAMTEAIIRHENGSGPLGTANTWYDNATMDEAMRLAGVRPPSQEVARVPVTKETIGATATGAVGAAQIVEVLPDVSAAITAADGHLSSGSLVRIVVGLVTVGIAVFIAWSQVRKHQSGAL